MAAKELRVDTEALQAMSARWVSLAGGLQVRSPDGAVGACSSAAAVAAGDAGIAAAAGTLRARVSAGAAKVTEAAMRYDRNEAGSADTLAALTRRADA
ncbi:MAG TPA: hypothetical protein VFQ37_06550 [Mycobacterium sp.]|nr:hypothetical protein [Mycobacterium sp.]